jgi:DNA-binding MarR family transcriptional regulator
MSIEKLRDRQSLLESLAGEVRSQALDLKGELLLAILYTAILFNRYLEIETAKRESNPTRFGILHNLVTHDGVMTPTNIGKRIFKSKHAVSRAVDVLEKDGLVRRQPISGDRRLRRISITRKGLDFVKSNLAEMKIISDKVFSCLNTRQAEELRIISKKLREHLLGLIDSSND